jgi:hypothetical protein
MEDVLEVYTRPYDQCYPQVCFDEGGVQLRADTRPPLPLRPGRPARQDYEYERRGGANLFMINEPLRGWREVWVTERHTAVDVAHVLRRLVDEWYPEAERIVLVCDNLNVHSPASLYAAYPPDEARRLASKLEWHYTPKHASWLDMAELELSVLVRQCLARRWPDLNTLKREVAAWVHSRNSEQSTIDWRFTTADARIKLKHLYPAITL